VKTFEIHWQDPKGGVRQDESPRSATWDGINCERKMPESVGPEDFGQVCIEERAPEKVADFLIGSFSNPIQLRGMRGTRFIGDSSLGKIFDEFM
jgi:hypothetical protein